MQFEKPFADDQPQPEKQRVIRPAQIFIQPGDGVDVSLLDHVGCVDPRLQPTVETQVDHAAQRARWRAKSAFRAAWSPARACSRSRVVSAELLFMSVPISY